ncbi:sulfotransferase [Oceanibium sediminis]|uniref:sulfotransferase n=1 Tax=Oceanibium sediminis TaxID=2026339 RepID=UPI000DD4B323|nr:sulfotransferase [Oceanibium sediminis]
MPNPSNITRPISLVSHGRSGTSLVMNILGAHPDVMTVGETAPMLFGIWHAVERVKGIIRPDPELAGEDHDARCAKAVRAAFLATFPDPDPAPAHWMQKPINMPWVTNHLPGIRDMQGKAAWYWHAFHSSFPESRTITVLRHPYDVVASAMEWWNASPQGAWDNLVRMAKVIDHPDSGVAMALSHQRLAEDPAPEVARLLTHLGLRDDPACLAAVDRVYVARRGTGPLAKGDVPERVASAFSRQDRWSTIDMSGYTTADRDALAAMWARFGEHLQF